MSQLRSFKAYGQVAPVVVSTIGCNLCDLDGTAAAAGFLQIFDLAAAPAGGTVPLKSFDVTAAGPLPSLFQVIGPIRLLNGLVVAMSSTEGIYTAVATSYDVFGELEEWEFPFDQIPTTAVGNILNQDSATVWADGGSSSNNRLVRATVQNTEGATVYLMLFSQGPVAGDKPLEQWKILDGTTLDLRFGTSGIPLIQQVLGNPGPGPAVHHGCTFVISTTPTVYTPSVALGCNFTNLTYRSV